MTYVTTSLEPKPIPVNAAKLISEQYGYDQVIIYGRNCLTDGTEHITTYGRSKELCTAAGAISRQFQKWMGWIK